MNLISIKYHKIVDFERLFFCVCQNTWETNREDSHPGVELGLTGRRPFQQTSARLVPSPLRCLFRMIRP